jgi:hypothetical protein
MVREMLGIAEGILQDLHNDHNDVAALLERIGDSENGAERSAVFKEMSTLLAHAKAEQEVLYSRMENSPNEESRRFALEGTSEHGLIEQQLQKLSGMSNPMNDAGPPSLRCSKTSSTITSTRRKTPASAVRATISRPRSWKRCAMNSSGASRGKG